MRQTRFGITPQVGITSKRTTVVMDPVGGVNYTQPPSDLPLGQASLSENWITRFGYLEKRGMLASRSTQSVNPGTPILGGLEVTDVAGNAYPWASYATRPVWYSVGSWSVASYVSAWGVDAVPSNSSGTYWDACQVYYAKRDENIVVFAADSYQTLYCQQSGTTVFSTLTEAPMAKRVTSFDNFLIAANISQDSVFVQRVQWSDRGSADSWGFVAGSLAGFADLLDMKGAITRVVPHDNVVLVFSDQEVWAGRRQDFPNTFDFQPLDRTVGAPYPWTVAEGRLGIFWLGKDWNVYLLPKGEVQARRIGDAVQPMIQREIDLPERATACYNRYTDQYECWYPVQGGNGRPQKAVFFDCQTGAWSPQVVDPSLDVTRVWQGTLGTGSASTTWSGASGLLTWGSVTGSWAGQFGVTNTGPLAVYAGTSGGTLYTFSGSATSDAGITVGARWRSGALHGGEPERSKTLQKVLVDYVADSASSLSVNASANQGATFEAGEAVSLGNTSSLSQADAFMYLNSRYPVIELSSQAGRPKIARVWAEMRIEGR